MLSDNYEPSKTSPNATAQLRQLLQKSLYLFTTTLITNTPLPPTSNAIEHLTTVLLDYYDFINPEDFIHEDDGEELLLQTAGEILDLFAGLHADVEEVLRESDCCVRDSVVYKWVTGTREVYLGAKECEKRRCEWERVLGAQMGDVVTENDNDDEDDNGEEEEEEESSNNNTKTDLDSVKKAIVDQFFVRAIDPSSIDKTYIPPPIKTEKKKMVRYRGNQVVTTRGERILVEKPAETEEMKKTYINLKPARKYRFH